MSTAMSAESHAHQLCDELPLTLSILGKPHQPKRHLSHQILPCALAAVHNVAALSWRRRNKIGVMQSGMLACPGDGMVDSCTPLTSTPDQYDQFQVDRRMEDKWFSLD